MEVEKEIKEERNNKKGGEVSKGHGDPDENKKESRKKKDLPRRTVFVKNIPLEASKEEIEHFFGEIGPIRRTILITEKGNAKQSRGMAYIQL